MCSYVCICVFVYTAYVWVCERERHWESAWMYMCEYVCVIEWDRVCDGVLCVCLCVYLCVWESVCICARKREREMVRATFVFCCCWVSATNYSTLLSVHVVCFTFFWVKHLYSVFHIIGQFYGFDQNKSNYR